jgi:hypothetical protein
VTAPSVPREGYYGAGAETGVEPAAAGLTYTVVVARSSYELSALGGDKGAGG